MKIFIDLRMIEMSGIGRYIKNILDKNIYLNNIVGLGNYDEIKQNSEVREIEMFNSKIYGIREQFEFPYNKIKDDIILHIPHYNIPLFYKGNLITTIHDITHILFPEYLPNKFALYYAKFMIKRAVKKSKYILTVSENTKQDLIKYFNADPDKIIVTYNGVDSKFKKVEDEEYAYIYEKYNIPKDKDILLYVGNKKPHKNISKIIEVLHDLNNKENKYVLLLSGKDFDGYNELEILSKKLNVEKSIIHTGLVTDKELVYLYNLANIFIFPSLYEGFGIPVLEAMSCGTPVISSNTSSMPEVVGDAGVLVNPNDKDEIKRAVELLINDVYLRENIIKKGYERSKKFTWEKCRNKTECVYSKIINDFKQQK